MTRTIQRLGSDVFAGLSLAGNILTLDFPFTRTFKNIIVDARGDIHKRNGYKIASQKPNVYPTAGFGVYLGLVSVLLQEDETSVAYAKTVEELLTWNSEPGLPTLMRQANGTIDIGYVGAGTLATFSFLVENGVWTARLIVDGVDVPGWIGGKTYGTGEETTATLLSALVSDIDGEADFTCTQTVGSTTAPAASLAITPTAAIGASLLVEFGFFEDIYTELVTGLSPQAEDFDKADYDIPNAAVVGNTVYWGRDQESVNAAGVRKNVYKYDGIACYLAKLDNFPATIDGPNTTLGADGTTLLAGDYTYRCRTRRTDNKGNTVFTDLDTLEGTVIAVTDIGLGGRTQVNLRIEYPSIAVGQPVGVRAARMSLTGTGTVLPYSANTLVVGDRVFFQNGDERKVVSIDTGGSTITVDASVSVTNLDYISNTQVEIYRTIKNGLIFYALDTVPVELGGAVSQITYTDTTDDSIAANAELVEPLIDYTSPPPAKFVTEHQGLMVYAGIIGNPNKVFVSDIESPEYVPATNSFDVSANGTGEVLGVGSDGERLYIFKENSYVIIHGDLRIVDPGRPPDINIEDVNEGIGCVSHSTIKLGREGLYFLSHNGPQRFIQGRLDPLFAAKTLTYFRDVVEDGTKVNPRKDEVTSYSSKLFLRRASATYDSLRRYYIISIPITSAEFTSYPTAGSVDGFVHATNARMFVYEEIQDTGLGERWYEWTSNWPLMGAINGMAIHKNKIYLNGVFLADDDDATYDEIIRGHILEELMRTDQYRYADNVSAIDGKYHTPWINYDNPSVYKQLLRIRVWRKALANLVGGIYTIRAFRNLVDESVAANAFVEATMDFTTPATLQDRIKSKLNKFTNLLIEVGNNVIHQDLHVTAIEINPKVDYEGGEIEKL